MRHALGCIILAMIVLTGFAGGVDCGPTEGFSFFANMFGLLLFMGLFIYATAHIICWAIGLNEL